ncbi:hypothetical protein BpHYR1_034564 [Brachionus plicatilis]|uniref:Uncharacterized protein n=1 Tax=Brachionus plicatilis TaxID=10195 RepID=A0A3M7R0N6_BRAPC|nr:hypothetical protein BpHYR1_034564 [Brachionus plicatilis]
MFMQTSDARFRVNMFSKTEATSVRLQHAFALYHVQLIKLDSGCDVNYRSRDKAFDLLMNKL